MADKPKPLPQTGGRYYRGPKGELLTKPPPKTAKTAGGPTDTPSGGPTDKPKE